MEKLIIVGAACLLTGGLLFAAIAWAMGRIKKVQFTKLLVGFLVTNAVVWVYLSYGLAWNDRIQIAETLSQTALIQIIAVFFVYGVKSLFENISMHNSWPDKPKEGEGNEP